MEEKVSLDFSQRLFCRVIQVFLVFQPILWAQETFTAEQSELVEDGIFYPQSI